MHLSRYLYNADYLNAAFKFTFILLILTKLEIDNLKMNQYDKKQQHWLFTQKIEHFTDTPFVPKLYDFQQCW